jgi:hypothetical protein
LGRDEGDPIALELEALLEERPRQDISVNVDLLR